jgi:hypothetical protein
VLWLAIAVASVVVGGPSHRLHYSFEQQGVPKEVVGGVRSTTSGSGYVTYERPLVPGRLGYVTEEAKLAGASAIVHVDRLAGRTLRLTLRPVGAELSAYADGSRMLELNVRVVASNDPGCRAGARGTLGLDDNPSGVDVVDLYLCPTLHEHYYENGIRGRVKVVLG